MFKAFEAFNVKRQTTFKNFSFAFFMSFANLQFYKTTTD